MAACAYEAALVRLLRDVQRWREVALQAEIRAAILAEREECAETVWRTIQPRLFSPSHELCDIIAKAIRARRSER